MMAEDPFREVLVIGIWISAWCHCTLEDQMNVSVVAI